MKNSISSPFLPGTPYEECTIGTALGLLVSQTSYLVAFYFFSEEGTLFCDSFEFLRTAIGFSGVFVAGEGLLFVFLAYCDVFFSIFSGVGLDWMLLYLSNFFFGDVGLFALDWIFIDLTLFECVESTATPFLAER